ncbi:MAG: hypothetical protein HY000_14825, partial [Planctomycetes bacterium]|nr:hypothetical protein [Planctomycetota bacterium]
ETYGQMFRSVKVDRGRHSIVWTYRPVSLLWGGVISVLSLVVVILIGVVARPRIQAAPSA